MKSFKQAITLGIILALFGATGAFAAENSTPSDCGQVASKTAADKGTAPAQKKQDKPAGTATSAETPANSGSH